MLSLTPAAANNLINADFRSQLGHSIHVLLSFAISETYKQLQLESILMINDLILILDKEQSKTRIGSSVLAWFLPGISVGVSKVLKNGKTNRETTIHSLKLFGNLISSTLRVLAEELPESLAPNEPFVVSRNSKWAKETSEKLNILFESFFKLVLAHQYSDVKMSLCDFVYKLLNETCSIFLNTCLSSILQIPLTLLNDADSNVAQKSLNIITNFSTSYTSQSYHDILYDDLYSYLLSLPRVLRNSSDLAKPNVINLLYGYIVSLGSLGMNNFLHSSCHKQRLFQCLTDIAQFNFKAKFILEEIVDKDVGTISVSVNEKTRSLLFLNDAKTLKAFLRCCSSIATQGDSNILLDYIVSSLRQDNLQSNVIFVVNALLPNLKIQSYDLDEIFYEYQEQLENFSQEFRKPCLTLQTQSEIVVKMSFILEGVEKIFSLAFNFNKQDEFLLKFLYTLLEKVGSKNSLLSRSANNTMQHIAYLYKKSVRELMNDNIDYLLNTLHSRLRYFDNNLDTVLVVKVISKNCSVEVLDRFDKTVNLILSAVDFHHLEHSVILMQILRVIVSEIVQRFNDSNSLIGDAPTLNKQSSLLRDWVAFLRNKEIVETVEDTDDFVACETNGEEECEESKKEPLPVHINILIKIFEKCINFIGGAEKEVRITALEIVTESLSLLNYYEGMHY